MLVVSLADFTEKVETYIKKAEKEDILIEDNGKTTLTLSAQNRERTRRQVLHDTAAMKSLFGILPSSTTIDDIKEARLARHT